MSYEITRSTGRGGVIRPNRATGREIDTVKGTALVKAARVEAIGFVTHVALQQLGFLTNLEAQLIEQIPLGEGRYKAIVDVATGAIAAEVAGMVF